VARARAETFSAAENFNGRRRTANGERFSAASKSSLPFRHFLSAELVKTCEIAAQRLRKKWRTVRCAKDAEKARKICGFTCGFAARNRLGSGGKAAEMPSIACGTNSMNPRIVKFDFVFSHRDDFTLFWPPLDSEFYQA
jgi:hypothetical protein